MFSFPRIFSRKASDPPRVDSFPYPIVPCPPISIYSPYFAPEELPLSSVSTIAAPVSVIRAIDPGTWIPEFPLIVFSNLGAPMIADEDRDFIWNTFGVPVFEYLLDEHGRILAKECEAHEGLHFESLPESCKPEIIEESCECGTPGLRLKSLDVIIV